jgi:hypothetical protein
MYSVEQTTNLSIIVQVLTGIVSMNGIFLTLPKQHGVLVDILKLETIVQIVELFFYVYFLRTMSQTVKGMAATRYFDWVITTPTMLLTTIIYFKYEEYIEKGSQDTLDFWEFVKGNQENIKTIFICNFLMLLFGYLGEIGAIDLWSSIVFGFLFFALAFFTIYKEYAVHSKIGRTMFNILVTVWGLYGIAAMTSDVTKNNAYNILDIFAKNFFGLYLFYKANLLHSK